MHTKIVSTFVVLIILGVLCAILFRDGAKESAGPGTGNTNLLPTPTPETTASPLIATATPRPTVEIASALDVKVRVTWKDNAFPVEGATVSLIPLRRISESKEPLPAVSGVTNKTGMVTLKFPPDTYSTKTLICWLETDCLGAKPLAFKKTQYVADNRILELAIEKIYEFHGTVYWRPQGGDFVVAPGAEISAVEADPSETRWGPYTSNMASTFSDAKGHYEFRTMPSSPLRLWARLGKYVTVDNPLPVMPKRGERSGPFDIYLEPGETLTVLVSDKTTLKPIPDAMVTLKFRVNGLSPFARTDSEGFCTLEGLPRGAVQATVVASGYANEYSPLQITSEENKNAIPFFLSKGGVARIHTVDRDGESPVANVSVMVVCGKVSMSAVSDADGIALVEGIPLNQKCSAEPTGNYCAIMEGNHPTMIVEQGGNRAVVAHFTVDAKEPTKVIIPVLDQFPRGGRRESADEYHAIEGVIVNEAGEPVSGAIVTAYAESIHASTLSDARGEFRLENIGLSIFPSRETSLPSVETLGGIDGYYRRSINLSNKDSYVPRQGHVGKDGFVVPYYVAPAILRVKAAGYAPIRDLPAAIDRKTKIVLSEANNAEFSVVVLDAETKSPLTDYLITYSDNMRVYKNERRVVSDEGRAFLSSLSFDKEYTFIIDAKNYMLKTEKHKPDEKELNILLEPQKALVGLVVDAESMEPVAGVEVRSTESSPAVRMMNQGRIPLSDAYYMESMFTDAKGVFTFKSKYAGVWLIFLPKDHPHFCVLVDDVWKYEASETGEIIIPLEKPTGSASVSIFKGSEIILEKRKVDLTYVGPINHDKFPSPTFRDGVYSWENLPSGRCRISGFISQRPHLNGELSVTFDLAKGKHRSLLLGKGNFASLSGQVLQSEGVPFTAKTSFVLEISEEIEGDQMDSVYNFYSDGTGKYMFGNISPGNYIFSIQREGFSQPIIVEGNMIHDFEIPKDTKVE